MTMTDNRTAVYGAPLAELVDVPADARQCSPLYTQSAALEDCPDSSLDAFFIYAPGGALERKFILAHALRALKPSGELTVMAPVKRGGQRLKSDLETMGCAPSVSSKRHHKIAVCQPPDNLAAVHEMIEDSGPRLHDDLGLWTQPGVFSWDRPDPGSLLLMEALPELTGQGADLGCGLGVLAHRILQSEAVTSLTLVDIDRRAIEMAWRNVGDERIRVDWRDVREGLGELKDLDFVVMNPPFHDTGEENKSLGKTFIKRASEALKKGGVCWIVANRHLPYEDTLDQHFKSWRKVSDEQGYKVIEAIR